MKAASVKITFRQDATSANDAAYELGYEELTVEYTSDLGLHQTDGEGYFILTTEPQGFGIEDEEEIKNTFEKIKKFTKQLS